jgi:alkylation response protein AidB-like acyl-CoA dehydrogenase
VDPEAGEDQRLWRDTVRRFLETEAPIGRARALIDDEQGYDPALYRRMAALGWTAPLAPEGAGGGSVGGRPFADLAVVAEEMGRTLTPAPVIEVNLGLLALRLTGTPASEPILDRLVSGRSSMSLALAGATGDGWNPDGDGLTAEPTSAGGWRLIGERAAVPFGHSVDLLLAVARGPDGDTRLFIVPSDSQGLRSLRLESLDLTRPLARVEFDGVELGPAAAVGSGPWDPTAYRTWLAAAVALQATESTGALARVVEMSLEYAGQRRAFGRAIGSFQAVKHRLADMALWLEWARTASALAVQAADEWLVEGTDSSAGPSAERLLEAASVAKVVIGEFGPALVRSAVQVHGGIGYTWEHDLHLYLRRVESNAALLGTADFHRDELARRIGFPELVAG